MLKKLKKLMKENKGFTLIEIVLVLAIAGLILVVVFLAVGGAQRARRDSQRNSDASRISALVLQIASNNNGTLPTLATMNTAIGSPLQSDPDGTAYAMVASAVPVLHQIGYVQAAFCPGIAGTAGPRDYSIYAFQEATPAVRFCVDTH